MITLELGYALTPMLEEDMKRTTYLPHVKKHTGEIGVSLLNVMRGREEEAGVLRTLNIGDENDNISHMQIMNSG